MPATNGKPGSARAVFLDRDGVINKLIYHRDAGIVDSPFTIQQFTILPNVPGAIRALNRLGLKVVVVSNQPGIAKAHFSLTTLRAFDSKLEAALRRRGAHLDAIYYCLHHPDAVVKKYRRRCSCRKPGIGLFRQAARDLNIQLAKSYMVGDGITDIEAGSRAGCRTVFIGRWKCELCQFIHPPKLRPTFVAKDLSEVVKIISGDMKKPEACKSPQHQETTS
jgi:D-glycero-D-manno-heptose 1,7-bisphosphate phosphatase